MILWKEMLGFAGVPWVDRGANTSHGHINIKCCWCGDADPSHHLAIEEETGAYYCRRNPDHYGRSAWHLLRTLKIRNIDRLLDDYSTTPLPKPVREPEVKRSLRFKPAEDSPPAMDYLRSRGYNNPIVVSKRFGLMTAPYGKLAARIFFPLTNGKTEEYVGRAIHEHNQPKYLSTADVSRLYVPLPEQYEGGHLLLVEGPFDALRLHNTILEIFGRRFGTAVALLGLSLTSEKLLHLSQLIDQADVTYVVLDNDQPARRGLKIAATLENRTKKKVRWTQCPVGRKDLGEASTEETAIWLRNLTFSINDYVGGAEKEMALSGHNPTGY